MAVKNRFAEWLPEITEWRRDIHANPELMFDTHRTAALVADKLRTFGCDEVHECIGRTGVVGVIRGRSDGGGRVIGLRADMDALPIEEATGLDHASTVPGAMHACGHDGHTAMLLGAARYLAETRSFDGTVVVLFQPAEEGGGGAKVMVDEGVLDRFGVQEVYGMHNWPGHPVGSFAIRPGPFFASTDQFYVTVEGRGGHAAKPQDTVDSALVAAQIVVALQSVVARNADPVDQLVVSVTGIRTETDTHNVIPQRTFLQGTVRSLRAEVRDLAEARLGAVMRGVAEAFGATVTLDYERGYPVMVNHERETEYAAAVARAVAGGCAEAPLVLGGEDFAYMLEARPGAYILVGNGESAMVHHPEYDFNDEAIPAGCSWLVGMAEERLATS
ncbi:MAG: M20 family metallopeptidase [Rhodobacteraceae bacterium]|nr:M20 family metallopeptidase [Paracoccaceae bacterium]